MANPTVLADTPKDAMSQYIAELERNYYPWYGRASERLKRTWSIGQAVALLAGVLASVLAAAANEQSLARFGWIRTGLIILPLIGAFTSSLLAQTRVRELLALRERGRESMQALISKAKADYAATASDNARLAALHTTLVDAVSRIEQSQAADFFSIAPGGSATDRKPRAGEQPGA
jgi:hypothetical protein